MTLILPDPDIGRCQNYRQGTDGYGYPMSKRCLHYDGHSGRCDFPPDPPRVDPSTQGVYSSQVKPKRWVDPTVKDEPTNGP